MKIKLIYLLTALAAVFLVVSPAAAGLNTDLQTTIESSGEGVCLIGEEITFSGTNTGSDYTYLFITGPGLEENGNKLNVPEKAALTDRKDTFVMTRVDKDGRWEYTLDTEGIGLEAGTYFVFAVTEPDNKADLLRGTYSVTSLILLDPKVQAGGMSQTTGDSLVTIVSSGDGSYYMGEEIMFSGTNAGSDNTYLFITGPNLPPDGGHPLDPLSGVVSGNADTFAGSAVNSAGLWEYRLDTNGLGLAPGTYTIYAVTGPKSKADLSGGIYDTATIVIKKPFITAGLSSPKIIQGDELVITGTAEGNPHSVGVWVFGFDYWNGAKTGSMATAVPEDDASYRYVLGGDETAKMEAGEYIVVVQHPMYDDEPDIITTPGAGKDVFVSDLSGGINPANLFVVRGDSALRGSDAAEALIEAINSALVDDTYAKCTFVVEEKPGNEGGFFAAIGSFFSGLFG